MNPKNLDVHLFQGDALHYLQSLADSSVDLIVTDPPYYRVKDEPWDKAWDTPEGFLHWLDTLAKEWTRVLRPNGCLYCFASPKMAARVEICLSQYMNVLSNIVWQKEFSWYQAGDKSKPARCKVEGLRSWYQASERIIFAEKQEASDAVFEPLRAYLEQERQKAGLRYDQIDAAWQASRGTKGVMTPHWFGKGQWSLPTRESYVWLQNLFALSHKGCLARDYDDLKRECESLKRVFTVTANAAFTDVWGFSAVTPREGKHPCEKPAELIRHIIRSSSRPNASVLDSFMGSGVVGEVALQEGRKFYGSEIDPHWMTVTQKRLQHLTERAAISKSGVEGEVLPKSEPESFLTMLNFLDQEP